MQPRPSQERLTSAWQTIRESLLKRRNRHGHWVGKLSASALSTATAVMALEQISRASPQPLPGESSTSIPGLSSISTPVLFPWEALITRGLQWLVEHQNADGGWGDTLKSFSNISTTMLAHATLLAARDRPDQYGEPIARAAAYIEQAGGVPALLTRYGKDQTFSIPILTHCALAGLVEWPKVAAIPFELACVPHKFYAAIQMPVVSYALPALIAIGQVRHHFARPSNFVVAALRDSCIASSLRVLERIQPALGGFLEATPLTSFVTMSLAAKGLSQHPVAVRGAQFIAASVLPDGSWPIDTNLATWVTTLSVNALEGELQPDEKEKIRSWLLKQQYHKIHPYTNAAPGGWAWTDLAGGVPDADDTPGAMLALWNLLDGELDETTARALQQGAFWLRDLQNRDGGWPTFCRGWGTLPFDRSSCDITAHCLRAIHRTDAVLPLGSWVKKSIQKGFQFLEQQQGADGSWLPLWFGNQHAPDDINPVYGTAKVLAAYRDTGSLESPAAQAALAWLRGVQNADGGWGGTQGCPSSVEETALAVEILSCDSHSQTNVDLGLAWLTSAVESDQVHDAAPIGFYFAKLWYFEELYPLIFTAGALRRCLHDRPTDGTAARKG